jgi:hypothetical protein
MPLADQHAPLNAAKPVNQLVKFVHAGTALLAMIARKYGHSLMLMLHPACEHEVCKLSAKFTGLQLNLRDQTSGLSLLGGCRVLFGLCTI